MSKYFERKEELGRLAKLHIINMEEKYSQQIYDSINKSYIITPSSNILMSPLVFKTTSELIDATTVSAIFSARCDENDKITVLNFASYKHPGGMFARGSSAQEEMLCHSSTLYNVLSNDTIIDKFYKKNRADINYGLYRDIALVTPGIIFEDADKSEICDVITCAAPNATTVNRYYPKMKFDIRDAIESRIKTVLDAAVAASTDVLILGAFGCGVFGNEPCYVAGAFTRAINTTHYGQFKKVIYAVPKSISNKNFEVFDAYVNDK